MIDFSLTDEQKQLQQLARDFARREIMPIASEYDRLEELPWQIVEKATNWACSTPVFPNTRAAWAWACSTSA